MEIKSNECIFSKIKVTYYLSTVNSSPRCCGNGT